MVTGRVALRAVVVGAVPGLPSARRWSEHDVSRLLADPECGQDRVDVIGCRPDEIDTGEAGDQHCPLGGSPAREASCEVLVGNGPFRGGRLAVQPCGDHIPALRTVHVVMVAYGQAAVPVNSVHRRSWRRQPSARPFRADCAKYLTELDNEETIGKSPRSGPGSLTRIGLPGTRRHRYTTTRTGDSNG